MDVIGLFCSVASITKIIYSLDRYDDDIVVFLNTNRIVQRISIIRQCMDDIVKDQLFYKEINTILVELEKEIRRVNMKLEYNRQTSISLLHYGFSNQKKRIMNLMNALNRTIEINENIKHYTNTISP